MNSPVQVTVTGAAGNVAYALLFRIAAGELLGADTPVTLRLLDIEPALPALDGVAMELADGAFPLLHDVITTADHATAFDGTSWALLVGATPRAQGMERGDLLAANAASFGPQGAAIAAGAASDVRILVVGNPCNTNCFIARRHAPEIPDERWFAMTRLDENRAKAMLAAKSGTPVAQVTNTAIWGNHSATQFPDAYHARIGGRLAPEVIADESWLREAFIADVQNRGAAIIAARKHSSAASAAHAIIDSVRSVHHPTAAGDWNSMAVVSHGEYDVPEGLIFSYPVRSDGDRLVVVEGIEHDENAQARLLATTEELIRERDISRDF
ncbi:MAG TPA: malate dehydrogenase [Mycobacteriales bacterium]|nr:malate dehydrogenase [Mycobacteriales bacterium]